MGEDEHNTPFFNQLRCFVSDQGDVVFERRSRRARAICAGHFWSDNIKARTRERFLKLAIVRIRPVPCAMDEQDSRFERAHGAMSGARGSKGR